MTAREQNRRDMPDAAAVVDDLRAAGIRPAWFRLTQNGKTVEWGKRPPDRVVPRIPGVPPCRVTVVCGPGNGPKGKTR